VNKQGRGINWLFAIVCTALLLQTNGNRLFAVENKVFLREDFNDLQNWKPLFFPKIKQHTEYTIEKEGDRSYLRAESDASASGIIFKKEFNVLEYPKVKWRWKISNIYKKGDEKTKAGDDYPIRIYIIFKYEPDAASFGQRIKYGIAKKIYGQYPPHSSLNYIWANRKQKERVITNAYVAEAKMILLEAGDERAGQWVDEEINILEDYRMAFGIDPPAVASIAIMNDSDNTGERSQSYLDYIEVFR